MVSVLLVPSLVPMSSSRSDITVVFLLHIWVSSDIAVGLDISYSWGAVSVPVLEIAPHEEVLSGIGKTIIGLSSGSGDVRVSLKVAFGFIVSELLVSKFISLLLSTLSSPVSDGSFVVLLTKLLLKVGISIKIILGFSDGDSVAIEEVISPLDILLLVVLRIVSIWRSWVLLVAGPSTVNDCIVSTIVDILDSVSSGNDSFDSVLEHGLLLGLPDVLLVVVLVGFLVLLPKINPLPSFTLEFLQSGLSLLGRSCKSLVSGCESDLSHVTLPDLLALVHDFVVLIVEGVTSLEKLLVSGNNLSLSLSLGLEWLVSHISDLSGFSIDLNELVLNHSLETVFESWHWLQLFLVGAPLVLSPSDGFVLSSWNHLDAGVLGDGLGAVASDNDSGVASLSHDGLSGSDNRWKGDGLSCGGSGSSSCDCLSRVFVSGLNVCGISLVVIRSLICFSQEVLSVHTLDVVLSKTNEIVHRGLSGSLLLIVLVIGVSVSGITFFVLGNVASDVCSDFSTGAEFALIDWLIIVDLFDVGQ